MPCGNLVGVDAFGADDDPHWGRRALAINSTGVSSSSGPLVWIAAAACPAMMPLRPVHSQAALVRALRVARSVLVQVDIGQWARWFSAAHRG